jgi:hypothetical protein
MKPFAGWVSNVPGQSPHPDAPVWRRARCKTPEQRTRKLSRLACFLPLLLAVPLLAACDVAPSSSFHPPVVYGSGSPGTGYDPAAPARVPQPPPRQTYVPEPPPPNPPACNGWFSNCAGAATMQPAPSQRVDDCHGWWRVCHAWQ